MTASTAAAVEAAQVVGDTHCFPALPFVQHYRLLAYACPFLAGGAVVASGLAALHRSHTINALAVVAAARRSERLARHNSIMATADSFGAVARPVKVRETERGNV